MRKKSVSLFILSLFFVCSFSQHPADKKYSLITATDNASVSLINFADPYLSPLTYSGFGAGYQHVERKYFNPDNLNYSIQGKLNALMGIALNPAYSAATTYIGGAYSWGAFYHYRGLPDLLILAGTTADAQFGFKSNMRNVNNPINIDAAINLNIAAIVRYDFQLFRRKMRLNYEFESPVAGCMFVPVAGASYYEMFELWNLNDAIHFSSLHNKLGLKSAISVDYFMKRSSLNVGLSNQKLLYEANNMVFKQHVISLTIGFKYDFYLFKGNVNAAPANFISTDN